MFGSIIFATVSLASRTWLIGDLRAIKKAIGPRSAPLNGKSFASLYTLLHHFSVLGLILLFAYICEYHPPFPHGEKSYDRDEFFFLTALLFVVSAYTVHRNDGKDAAALTVGECKKQDDGSRRRRSPQDAQEVPSAAWPTASASVNVTATSAVSVDSKGGAGVRVSGSFPGNGSAARDGGEGGDENIDDESLSTTGTPASGASPDISEGGSTVESASESLPFLPPTKHRTATGRLKRGRLGERADRPALRPTSIRPVAEVVATNDVLNRDQTEEWKGWMQFIFLLYHYYSAAEVYNSIRIMITCYVWMTGFGNFSFFYLKGDYSAHRVLQMLWRLNFLVIFLTLSQGTTYILYYICPLHTYFFLMVYFTMSLGRDLNYEKYGIRYKLMFVACLIFAFWDIDSPIWKLVHFFLGETPVLGATGGTMWEWYFRTTLDHWSTFLGMLFALNYPITSLWYRKLEAQPRRLEWLGKGIVGVALFGCFLAWVIGPFQRPKFEYNRTNAYFGFIPLITYIYFRNLTPALREYSLDLLHQIGKTTLETYLMQHHIWLTSNAKSLLTLIPGWPRVNMLLVTLIYFFTSRRLYKLTLYLRGMLLPDSRGACIRSLGCLFGSIIGFYGTALILRSYGYTSLTFVAIVCVVCGMILYRIVIDASWDQYQMSSPDLDGDQIPIVGAECEKPKFNRSITRIAPPLFGAVALFVLGFTWHGMAEYGAGKIQPLPAHCSLFANDGQWIRVDGCNEAIRAEAYRKYDAAGFSTCGSSGGSYIWAWNATDPSTYCRFARRDSKQLKKTLHKRRLLFIGDSMTRNMYHAMLRALGVKGSGAYDATGPKHADISNEVGTVNVDFQWAPFASDQLEAFRSLNQKLAEGTEWERGFPDLIVVGGGAWDRLHRFSTEEDQETLKVKLRELKRGIGTMIQEGGAPVAWLVPTTVNDQALNTEEKRDHMTEMDMEDMRGIYADIGLLSVSSFVVEGPAFSRARVKESYDGVHYPSQVYDAGAQILSNSFDWLLPEREDTAEDFVPMQPGMMASPYFGLMMLCFVFVGLFLFDGFMGFSCLASICVSGVLPHDLYEEAFTALRNKANLPLEGLSSQGQPKKTAFASKGRTRSCIGFGARREFRWGKGKSNYAEFAIEHERGHNKTPHGQTSAIIDEHFDTGTCVANGAGSGDEAQSVRSRRSV